MHRQKRWHPHRVDKFYYQDMGFSAIPKNYRPPVTEIDMNKIDREMQERMRLDEYYRERQSA